MTFTREQRKADRDWCEQYNWQQTDEWEEIGHGIVLWCSVGGLVWIVAALIGGWI